MFSIFEGIINGLCSLLSLINEAGKDIFKLSSGKGFDLIQDFKNNEEQIFIGTFNKLRLNNEGQDVNVYKGKDLLVKVKWAKGDLSKNVQYLV